MKRIGKPRPGSAQKRIAIVDAAARAIARHGFHGMSMRELAAQTGQGVAGFYNYFSSKDELLFHIQRSAFQTMIAGAEDALRAASSPSDRLFAFIHQHVLYVAGHPDVMRILIHEAGALPPPERRKVRALKEKYTALGRGVVAELYQGDDLDRVTFGIFGMLNWVYGWYDARRDGTPAEVSRSFHRLALRGLTGDGRGRDRAEPVRRLAVVPPLSRFGGKP